MRYESAIPPDKKMKFALALIQTGGNCSNAERISDISFRCQDCFLTSSGDACPTYKAKEKALSYINSNNQDSDNEI